MIGKSLPEYVFIRLAILALRLIAPLSIAYFLFSLYHNRPPHLWIGLYAIAESAFYLLATIRRRFLQKAAVHPSLPSREEREALFARCFARIRDGHNATGWFWPAVTDKIKRENMIEWLLWALFGTTSASVEDEWVEEIDGYLAKIETLLGQKIEDGRESTTRCMKVTLDPVDTVHRPLLWYLIVACVDTVTGIRLLRSGFQHYTSGSLMTCFPPRTFTVLSNKAPHANLVYWLRPHRSTTKDPILFLHGIGIGLWPYVSFFREIVAADPSVGIIALETLSISMRMSAPPLSRPATLAALLTLLDAHGFPRVVVAAHSYGTVVAAHMLRDPALSPRVSAWLLVDPIPFLLHLPAVAYNFVYRAPRTANEWQLWYFASRDPDVARTLARHFFWAENVLWKEDLVGRDVAVVLSGADQIVDAAAVRAYLTGEEGGEAQFRWKRDRLEVLYYPDIDHSQVFETKERRRPLVHILHDFGLLGAASSCP